MQPQIYGNLPLDVIIAAVWIGVVFTMVIFFSQNT